MSLAESLLILGTSQAVRYSSAVYMLKMRIYLGVNCDKRYDFTQNPLFLEDTGCPSAYCHNHDLKGKWQDTPRTETGLISSSRVCAILHIFQQHYP